MANEQVKSRSMEDIQKDYTITCNKAGHLQYQIYSHNKDLELLNSQLRDLNFEAAKVQGELQKKAEEAAKAQDADKRATEALQSSADAGSVPASLSEAVKNNV